MRVQPKASRNEVVGWQAGLLKVRLTAPPVEGAANKALAEFLADYLGVRKTDVAIVTGEKGRTKVVEVAGLTDPELAARLPAP